MKKNCFKNYINRQRIPGVLDFFYRPVFQKLENTRFQKLDHFPLAGRGKTPTLLGPFERANLNHLNPATEVSSF
jgi:hypothetical protein